MNGGGFASWKRGSIWLHFKTGLGYVRVLQFEQVKRNLNRKLD
jgi:hypothetical protein